jgi:hypothetical protein
MYAITMARRASRWFLALALAGCGGSIAGAGPSGGEGGVDSGVTADDGLPDTGWWPTGGATDSGWLDETSIPLDSGWGATGGGDDSGLYAVDSGGWGSSDSGSWDDVVTAPPIPEGGCFPGATWKVDCNTCECLADGFTVSCTTLACPPPPPACPTSAPTVGAACSSPSSCTYGNSCGGATTYDCPAGSWSIGVALCNAMACPASQPTTGASCVGWAPGDTCEYAVPAATCPQPCVCASNGLWACYDVVCPPVSYPDAGPVPSPPPPMH